MELVIEDGSADSKVIPYMWWMELFSIINGLQVGVINYDNTVDFIFGPDEWAANVLLPTRCRSRQQLSK